jgi:hypothetical protein
MSFPTVYDLAAREGLSRADVDAGFSLRSFLELREARASGESGPVERYRLTTVDGGTLILNDLAEIFDLNDTPLEEARTIVAALPCSGAMYRGGGGAAPEWSIVRLDDVTAVRP